MQIAIITNREKDENFFHTRALCRELKKFPCRLYLEDSLSGEFAGEDVLFEKEESLFRDKDILIVLGGDGTIMRAARRFARDCADGKKSPDELTEAGFADYLWSAGLPDPELLIRTGGEVRLSNFLLWQCAYSEFYVTDTLWPDFKRAELDKALAWYATRERRFGGLSG